MSKIDDIKNKLHKHLYDNCDQLAGYRLLLLDEENKRYTWIVRNCTTDTNGYPRAPHMRTLSTGLLNFLKEKGIRFMDPRFCIVFGNTITNDLILRELKGWTPFSKKTKVSTVTGHDAGQSAVFLYTHKATGVKVHISRRSTTLDRGFHYGIALCNQIVMQRANRLSDEKLKGYWTQVFTRNHRHELWEAELLEPVPDDLARRHVQRLNNALSDENTRKLVEYVETTLQK